MLKEEYASFIDEYYPNEYNLQQDSSTTYNVNHTTNYFINDKLVAIHWLAHSPDLTPIQNLVALLHEICIKNRRSFDHKNYLHEKIVQ